MWWAPPVLDAETCDRVEAGRAHLVAMGYAPDAVVPPSHPHLMFSPPDGAKVVAPGGRTLAIAQVAYDCRLLDVEVHEPATPAAALTLEGALIRAAEAFRPWVGGQDDTLVALPRGRGAEVWLVRFYGEMDDPLQTVVRVRVRPDGSVGRAIEDRGYWTLPEGPAAARSTWSLFGDEG